MVAEADRGRGLVGAALAQALTAAIDGSGRLALLAGEAGIGKTTTARELTAQARRAGMTVRWTACSSGGATVAHAPWLTVLSGLGEPGRAAIDALVGSEAGEASATAAARAAAYAAVVAALEEATADRAALLVLDDLHWADEGTLMLLDVVAAHVPGLPVLVVGTYRDTDAPVSSPLHRLGGRADHHPLRGLDDAAVATLLGEQLGAARGAELAADVVALTAGNPFLVLQMARLVGEGAADVGRHGLPAGARDLLEQRLGALSADDRAVLSAAGVLGSPFRAGELEAVLGRETAGVAASLDRAAARRVVERAPGTGAWAFVHDLFRQAVLDGTPPDERAALHRTAAAMLERHDAEASVIAAHLQAATADDGTGAADAAAWSVKAGDRALAAMAWEEAAGHHERALGALGPGTDLTLRADALTGLGRARLLAGDDAGAGRAFDELAELARSEDLVELLARAALGFSADLSGFEVRLFDQHQIDLLEEADHALEASTASRGLRALVLARLSVALSLTGADARRLGLAEQSVALAREADEPIVLGRALAAHCDAISGPADVERREAEASEIIAIAEAAGDGPLELLGRRLRFVARLERGDLAAVEEDMAGFLRRSDTIGNPLYSWYVPLWQGQLAVVAGLADEADRLIEEAEARGRQAGSTNAAMLTTVLRLAVYWQRGDHQGAIEKVKELSDTAPEVMMYLSAVGSLALANALADRPVAAASYLDRAVALRFEDQPLDAEWLANLTCLVRAAALLGHPILAAGVDLLEPFADLISFEGIGAGLYGSVARYVALGDSALGRHDDAVRHAEHALTVNRGFGGMLAADALRTLADCRAARGDDGDADAAEDLHAQADAAYVAVGAHHAVRGTPEPGRPATTTTTPAPASAPDENELRRVGDVWHVTYAGATTVVRHSKGLADLAVLLARPRQEVHVTELEGVPAALLGGRGDDALDRRAIVAYKGRLLELTDELAEAEEANDLGRADRARLEYDALVDQLTGAVGLRGRARAAGPDPVDRARKAVSARIRDAIRRLEAAHEPLGRHLANAVRTGTYCSYQPEVPTVWRCQTGSGASRA